MVVAFPDYLCVTTFTSRPLFSAYTIINATSHFYFQIHSFSHMIAKGYTTSNLHGSTVFSSHAYVFNHTGLPKKNFYFFSVARM